jgi:hypothetical protein
MSKQWGFLDSCFFFLCGSLFCLVFRDIVVSILLLLIAAVMSRLVCLFVRMSCADVGAL